MSEKFRIKFNPLYPAARASLESLAKNGFPAESETIYRERNELRHFLLPELGGADVNVKSFHTPRFLNRIIYRTIRKSKARRSFENAIQLRQLGFGTPEPIGYCEVLSSGTPPFGIPGLHPQLTRSYYMCRQLPYPNIRDWENRPDLHPFVEALGAEVARLHAAGVWFHDFSPGNILVKQTEAGGYEFYYVDLNRMEFGVTDRRKLMQMFKSISWGDPLIELLARAYCRASHADESSTVALARAWGFRFRNGKYRKQNLLKRLGFRKGGKEKNGG